VNAAHFVICRPGQTGARERLAAGGIAATVYPAIIPDSALSSAPFATFGDESRPRTIKESGILLAILGVLGAGLASGAEWIGLWEEDVELVEGMDWKDVTPPADCGVLYLGGALWWPPEQYGEPAAGNVWRVSAPLMISCCHAVLIHRRAAEDILPVMASMSMTADDLLSAACINAAGRWSTCFMNPWLAWQSNRPETRPLTEGG